MDTRHLGAAGNLKQAKTNRKKGIRKRKKIGKKVRENFKKIIINYFRERSKIDHYLLKENN